MPMRFALLFIFTLIVGCGSGAGDHCGTPEEETRSAQMQWQDALADAGFCETDQDCELFSVDAACFNACGMAANASEITQLREFASDLDQRLDVCDGQPCPIPTCPPGTPEARCVENQCQVVRATPTPAP